MNNALVNVKDLTVGFETDKGFEPAVKNLDLTILKGETLALVGESGGGKSITALAMMQLLPPSARVSKQSQILFDKQDLLNFSEIQMLPA